MVNNFIKLLFFHLLFSCQLSCIAQNKITDIQVGAEQTEKYLSILKGKNIALVVNQTSTIKNTHLADSLKSLGIKIDKVFAPEHGFRGNADAGEHIANGIDKKSGLQVVSLYGKNYKPTAKQLNKIDYVVFDIQDVGARFYTYISTLHYVMEACAENNIPLIILDRPNPNGSYFDGPVLDTNFRSFVGVHPIPIVHGLTMGELAQMINGEKWLKAKKVCNIKIISCLNYTHDAEYQFLIKPSPNLPNNQSIYLYPSLCLFEGVNMASVGRGTDFPFQVYGGIFPNMGSFQFTPKPIIGMDKNPKFKDKTCFGKDLRNEKNPKKFTLEYVLDLYAHKPDTGKFFNNFFDKLAGTDKLRKAIEAGQSEAQIRASWQEDLNKYAEKRKNYLIYK